MTKGIRKACANCIKARLACDEGRPCQRCVVHACDCIAVPRKPRVKKQKLDLEPPTPIEKHKDIPSIDSNAEVVAPNWSQSDFKQGSYSSFQLDRTVQDEPSFDGCTPNSLLSTSSLTSLFTESGNFQLSPPAAAPSTPSPPQPLSPQTWTHSQNQLRLSQAALAHQYVPTTPVQLSPQTQQPLSPQQQLAQHYMQDIKPQLIRNMDGSQMLSLLMEEKPSTLLNEWTENQLGFNFLPVMNEAQQVFGMNYFDSVPFKKLMQAPSSLPQPMNATPLFPSPIAVFDKLKFQLLDANQAMANFAGHSTVAEFATAVTAMDDLIDPTGAQIAKNAYVNFIANPSPCYRLGEIRTRSGTPRTVEFHVDITDQLLIFSIKSVFDTFSGGLPDMKVYMPMPLKSDISSLTYKASELLAPID